MDPRVAHRVAHPHVPDLRKVLRDLHQAAQEQAKKAIIAFARRHRKVFIDRVRAQQFKSFTAFPLTPAWRRKKQRAGADPRTMIATGHYLNQVKTWTAHNPPGVVAYVGFNPTTRAKNLDGELTDITLEEVAAIQEGGSAAQGIPPRPHWGPYRKEMQRDAAVLRRDIAARVVKYVSQRLKRRK